MQTLLLKVSNIQVLYCLLFIAKYRMIVHVLAHLLGLGLVHMGVCVYLIVICSLENS